MRIRGRLPALALAACLAAAAYAQSAEPPPPAAAAEPAPAAMQPPATTLDATKQLDTLAAGIDAAKSDLPDIGAVLKAKAALDEIDRELGERLATLDDATVTGASLIVRDRLSDALARLDRSITTARKPLDDRASVLESHRSALRSGLDFITAALDADKPSADLPDTVKQRMSMLSREIERIRPRLRRAFDAVVIQTQRASAMEQKITAALQAVDAVRKNEERVVVALKPEQPPIWQAPPPLRGLVAKLRDNFAAARAMLYDAVTANPGGWLLLFLALPLLVAAMLALRRAAGADVQAQGLVLQYPVAAAVLIWAVLGPELLRLSFTSSHGLLRIVVLVAAAWPMLRVIAPASVQLPLRGLLILAIISIWLTALIGAQAGAFGFLLIGAAGLWLFRVLAAATARGGDGAANGLAALMLLGIRAGMALLAAGLVAVVLGAARLGQQLIEGVLVSTLVPVLVFVASQTLREVWDQVIERSPGRWLRSIRNHPDLLRRRGHQAINLLLALLVLPLIPRIFPFTAPIWEALGGATRAKLEVGGISLSALNVVALLVAITAAILLARFVRFVLDEEVMTRLPVAASAASAASRLVYYLLLTVGLLMALAAAGFELSQLTLVVSALGVGLGFGLQNIVSNFVSGVVLAFERPFQVGDLIAVGDQTGRVLSIGLRATNVRTLEGAEVIVPNSTFISGNVINWTLSDRMRRIDLPVGVAYGSDLRRVQGIIREVIDGMPELARHPEPLVVFTGFGDSSLDFRVLVWTPDADRMLVTTSDLAMAINDALKKAGVEIPFPQRDVHIRTQA